MSVITEEPEKDTYWVITKAQKDILLNSSDEVVKEVAKGAESYTNFNPKK